MSIQSNFPNLKPSLLLDFANTKQLDNRITFTRSTPAVYYDGKTTAMAEQNLLLQSQDFSTTWARNSTTVTTNSTAAPDGTTTADTVTTTSTDACLVYQAKPISTSGTISCYIKKGTSDFAYMYVDNPSLSGNAAFFDINTGVVGSFTGAFSSTSIVSVGNGWYRCVATFTGISGTNVGIGVCDSSSSTTVTSGRIIYIWGAQLEQRSTATAYTPTTTQPITNYIPVLLTAGGNQARFDCNPTTGESLGLLIEEQRTNLQIYSSTGNGWAQYAGANWIDSSVVAPNGQIQGADVTFANSSQMYSYTSTFSSSGIAVTASAYMKYRSGASIVGIGVYDNTQGNRYVYFDLANGTIFSSDSGASGTITSVGNGWYRCTNTKTVQNATGGMTFYANNGVCNIYTWGAQLEQASFASSYIATTSASATRTADAASMTGTNFTSWFNNGQGTFYAQANLSNGSRYFNAFKTSTTLQIEGVQAATYYESFIYDGAIQAQIQITAAQFTSHRVATAYAINDIAGCVDGGTVSTDTTALLPNGLDALNINAYLNSGPLGSGTIKKIAYYPLRLSNTNLQALTS
jgi:hypothetical protein